MIKSLIKCFRAVRIPFLTVVGLTIFAMLTFVSRVISQDETNRSRPADAPVDSPAQQGNEQQAEREAAFVKMLSGATLEGNFTNTARDPERTNLSREKYTLGEVKKLGGNIWLIPARIQYGDHDVTLPVTVPIQWAGDTPVIVVDNVGLPGFGTVSARVMFFADHYAGYWKHGRSGGHLFGVISREDQAAAAKSTPDAKPASSAGDAPAGEQRDK